VIKSTFHFKIIKQLIKIRIMNGWKRSKQVVMELLKNHHCSLFLIFKVALQVFNSIKSHLLVVYFVNFLCRLSNRESNPGCRDRILAWNHMTTLTPHSADSVLKILFLYLVWGIRELVKSKLVKNKARQIMNSSNKRIHRMSPISRVKVRLD